MEQQHSTTHWIKSRYVQAAGLALIVALVATGWWWNNRPPATIFLEGAVVIQEARHFAVKDDGTCLGTRTGYMGGQEVVIELNSGEEYTFEMAPGKVESSTCRLEFSGDVALSDTYTAHIGRYSTDPLRRGPNTRLVGTGETGEEFIRGDFIADPWDPWAGET